MIRKLDVIIDLMRRNGLEAFYLKDAKGEKTLDGVQEGGTVEAAIEELKRIVETLPSGTYLIENWKKGGAAYKKTNLFSVLNTSKTQNDGMSAEMLIQFGKLQAELAHQKQIAELERRFARQANKRQPAAATMPDFREIIVKAIANAPAIQSKIADLMGTETGQAFITNIVAIVSNKRQPEEEYDDDDEEDDDEAEEVNDFNYTPYVEL